MEEHRFDALVASVYEAAYGRAPWRAPLDALADAFESPRCILTGIRPDSRRPAFRDEGGRVDADAICETVRASHADDPILARLLRAPAGQWLYEDDPPHAPGQPRPAPVLAPAGLHFAAGVRLEDGPLAVLLALTRGRRRHAFDTGQRQALARIAFHFEAGLAIEARRSIRFAEESPGLDAITSQRHPLWLIDGHRRVHMRNAAAETMVRADGPLTEADGQLRCTDPAEDTELACALVRLELANRPPASGQPPRRAVVRIGVEPNAHAILLSGQPRRDEAAGALAVVRCSPLQSSSEPDPDLLVEVFELTLAEAQVASQLARGLSAVEIATARGVSTQTVRAQIRAVFEKTGIKRQSDLIRLLVEMPDIDARD